MAYTTDNVKSRGTIIVRGYSDQTSKSRPIPLTLDEWEAEALQTLQEEGTEMVVTPTQLLKAIALLRKASPIVYRARCDCRDAVRGVWTHTAECAYALSKKWLADLAAFKKG